MICSDARGSLVKLYHFNQSCVNHASPQLKTWNVGQPVTVVDQTHSTDMNQLSFGKHTFETSRSQVAIYRRKMILRQVEIFHGHDEENDDISQCTAFLTGYTIADAGNTIYDLELVPIWASPADVGVYNQ